LLASDLRLLVGWWYLPNQQRLPMTDFEDNSLDSVVLDAGGLYVDAPVLSDDWQSMETDLGAIGLRGVCRDGEHIQLIWEALQPLSDDFTVFVQALDSDDNIVAQGDAPPMLATRHWRIGDRHVTQHRLRPADNVTEGGSIEDTARIVVGWYHPTTFERLLSSDGTSAIVLPEAETDE
jgi:hypothetical protein